MKKKNFLFTIMAFIMFFVIFFCVGEILFRLFGKPENPLNRVTQKNPSYLFKPNVPVEVASSKPEEFDYFAQINSFGYRGKDFNAEKTPGTVRLFFIGDSFTFGVGAKDDETVPYLAGEALKTKAPSVEVINAGIGSTSPINHYVNLRNIHMTYHPDFVVLLFDMTDLWDDWNTEKMAIRDQSGDIVRFNTLFNNGKRDWWKTCAYYSRFCRWIDNKIVRSFNKITELGLAEYLKASLQGKRAKAALMELKNHRSDDDVIMKYDAVLMMRGLERKILIDKHWPRTAMYLTKIKEFLDQNHIPLMIVTYPHGTHTGKNDWPEGRKTWGFEPGKLYTDTYGFDIVEQYCREHNIPVVRVFDDYLKEEKRYFYDWDGHMTPQGYKVLADGISKNNDFNQILQKLLSQNRK